MGPVPIGFENFLAKGRPPFWVKQVSESDDRHVSESDLDKVAGADLDHGVPSCSNSF